MSSARISNSKDIYIYIYDIRRDEKRVENLVGGNVATKARFLVHEINHTRVRVMDERRKRGNTSGSLKRSWSQQGWREREGGREGGPIVEQRRSEKFQFYGRLKNRRWRLAGVKNYRGDSAGFTRGRSSFSKPLITPPPFSSNIHSFVHSCRTAFRTLPQLIPVNKNACPLFEGPPPLEGRKHEGRVKRALVRRRSNCLFRYR